MKIVQKANKQLRIPDERLDDMRKAGFVEINPKTGKPIKDPDPIDALKKENAVLKKEVEALKAELDKLKAEQ